MTENHPSSDHSDQPPQQQRPQEQPIQQQPPYEQAAPEQPSEQKPHDQEPHDQEPYEHEPYAAPAESTPTAESAPSAPYSQSQPWFYPSPAPSTAHSGAPYPPPAEPHRYGGFGQVPEQATTTARTHPGRTVLVAAVTAAVVGGGIGAGTVAALDNNKTTTVSSLPQTAQTAPPVARINGTITAAAAKIQPSVVTINVSGRGEQGTGSGVIIKDTGYILTNDHVVSVADGGGSMTVITQDGQQASAKVVGRDSSDDLAVVKVNGLTHLTPATFARSSNLVVGQTVVAVGAPLGLSDTVTSGIVSNTARPVRSGDSDQAVFDAVQTDAAINPGNSGGPLVDLNGNVVGINAAIATANSGGLQIPGQSTESGSIGIGFAIPADEASRIAGQLIATGKASHAVLGVKVSARQNSTTTTTGATLASIDATGAAAKVGLKTGDRVTRLDSQRIDDADGLIAAVRSHAPGDTVSLTYVRGGASKTVRVTLGSASN
ncbi:MAG TPA: trypsin-like peptidase domain-containing protein [Actinopolymorphaceae bacterium]|nr:trypsin-like peptidase domain-containing protein [Actinopolymorphaceae bacterium]